MKKNTKRLLAIVLCLCSLLSIIPFSALAADRHRILYDSATLPIDQLVFTVGDTVTLPFKLYRGSAGSSYENYYINIYDSNGNKEYSLSKEFNFGSYSVINLSVDWTIDSEPGTYYLEYYDSSTYNSGHTKLTMTVKARANEIFTMDHTKTIAAVTGNPSQATCAWFKTTATLQRYSFYDPIKYEIQLKEMVIGVTAAGIANSENSYNDKPTDSQQWIFMRFYIKNLGGECLEAHNIIHKDYFFNKQGSTMKIYDTAALGGSRGPYNPHDVNIYAGAGSDVWYGILVDKSAGFPLLQLSNGYSNSKAQFAWIDTDPYNPAAHQHTYTLVSENAPTCTLPGTAKYACYCGASYSNTLAALGHNMVYGSCNRCGSEVAFNDVAVSDYFYAPVVYAVKNNITNGTSTYTFSPNDPCTRGQIVTFLWRAFGSPDPTSYTNPFTDVSSNQYYYKAVLWAVENSITSGMSATTFAPDATCTRAQAATFLWRASASPSISGTNNPFTDVATGTYYYVPVLWAVENGITKGTAANKFSPDDFCTRGQIVTFLYRALAK